MTAGTGFAGTNMLRLVRQQELEFYTLPFAGLRERKGVFYLSAGRKSEERMIYSKKCAILNSQCPGADALCG